MNILEDLWFGNISPWARPFKKDSAYAKLLARECCRYQSPRGAFQTTGSAGGHDSHISCIPPRRPDGASGSRYDR